MEIYSESVIRVNPGRGNGFRFLYNSPLFCYHEAMKSPKELSSEKKLLSLFEEGSVPGKLAHLLTHDAEIQNIQEYGNNVSIRRLGFNDHGPVHMRQVAINAIRMLQILHKAGIQMSLEKEAAGTFEDSTCAVLLAAFMHDLGMTIGRQDHELMSAIIAKPIIRRLLESMPQIDAGRRIVIECMALEGIVGHMATRKIHSLEAGLVLIADGCDMQKGRARIPLALNSGGQEAHYGDIHKYSANSIQKVTITEGEKKPIRITVQMTGEVGCFQIEEVLIPKINMSPSKQFLELVAVIGEDKERYYL